MIRPRLTWLLGLLWAGAVGGARAEEAGAQTTSSSVGAVTVLTGTVRGRLDGEVRPVPFARVDFVVAAGRLAAVADGSGRYVIEVPSGDAELSVEHLGYEPMSIRVTVPSGSSVTVDLELTAVPVPLPGVDILGGPPSARGDPRDPGSSGAALTEVDLQALEVGPGVGQPGLADVVSALPGNDPDDATDVLFMRGSTADLKLVLLDGVPVYTPFHVAGLMKSFEQNVLGAAELHVGAAPARFDGGLTHILDLRTRPARSDRLHVSGALDMLSASAAVETPLGDAAGVIVSGRSLHGLGADALGGAPPYGYRDLLLSASARPAADHQLRSTAFFNEESVLLDESHGLGDARWANLVSSLGYRTTRGGTTFDVTGGVSGYRADLPLQPSPRPGQPPGALLASARTDRARVVGEVQWGEPGSPNRAGLSFESISERYSAQPLAGGLGATSSGSVRTLGAFLDVTRPITKGLSLRMGLRADRFGGTDVRFAPRGMLAWEIAPQALVTLALGRYHQPTRGSEAHVDLALAELADELGVPPSDRLPVATADHVVLGLRQRFTESVRLDIQGFWKGYHGLPSSSRESVRSSGVDVRIVTAGDGRAAWLGYGLSWFWSSVDLSGTASEFVGRHLLSAGASGRLLGPLEAEARLAYGAGLPYTSIPFGTQTDGVFSSTISQVAGASPPTTLEAPADPLVEGLDEEFLRLDLEIHAVFEPEWGGRTWRVRPYLRILNALDRRDALFYTFQPWRDEAVTPVAERPALPLLGVAFSF
jgi:hypothetical protein